MSVKAQSPQHHYLQRPPVDRLTEVMELVLDKGLIIDTYARVDLAGIEVATVDAHMVIASVDTYLRFAAAISRLDLRQGGTDVTARAANVTGNAGEDRRRVQLAPAGNGIQQDYQTRPQLDGPALVAVEPDRDVDLPTGTESPGPAVATRPPGLGHVRPYDWKKPATSGLLR
jgi:hypothetical protein